MSRVGLWCAIAGATLGIVTIATWNLGTDDTGETAAPVLTAAPLDGEQLFVVKGCSRCHLGPDTTPYAEGFPPLNDATSWAGTRKEGMTAEEYLAESMRAPGVFTSPVFTEPVGGTPAMPGLLLSEEEIDALVAYLLGR